MCIEVWHLGRFRPLFLPHNSTWALAEGVFRHEGIDLQHWLPVPLYPGNADRMRCVLVPRTCPQGLALAFVHADGVALGEVFLSPSDTACSVAALCGRRPQLTTVSLAGHPWRSSVDGLFHGMCLVVCEDLLHPGASDIEGLIGLTSPASSLPALLLESALGHRSPSPAFPISLEASLSFVGVGAVEGLIALKDTAIFLQQTLAGAQPFPLYPGLEGVDLPTSTRRTWHCIAPPRLLPSLPFRLAHGTFRASGARPHVLVFSVKENMTLLKRNAVELLRHFFGRCLCHPSLVVAL